ncbi:MAG: class I SAM-dependent methyltransferase family protein [archaeon]
MTFKNMLKEKFKDKIDSEKLEKLPSGFQKIGNLIILNLHDDLVEFSKEIGKVALELNPGVRSVCRKTGIIIGEFREPQIEVIAGDENTVTTHIENGCKYRFDIRKVMFAKGNVVERSRIAKQVKDGEIIVDMFAGIGYFSVPIGVLSKPEKVYSIELNPVSYEFLKENLKINHIHNIEAINASNKDVIDRLVEEGVKADRVLMGYLPPPKEFLPWAFKIVKKDSIIHYEDLVSVDNKEKDVNRVVNDVRQAAKQVGFDVKLMLDRKVKSYGPKRDHYVFDFKVV